MARCGPIPIYLILRRFDQTTENRIREDKGTRCPKSAGELLSRLGETEGRIVKLKVRTARNSLAEPSALASCNTKLSFR